MKRNLILNKNTYLIVIFVFIYCLELLAQQDKKSENSESLDFFGYPFVFYTPETNFAFGAGGMVYFRTSKQKGLHLSNILLSGYYTINNQYSVTITPQIYFSRNKYITTGKLNFGKFLDKFYGYGSTSEEIDNPDYFTQNFAVNLNLQMYVSKNFAIGGIYDLLYSDIIDKENNPYLVNNLVVGSNGGLSSGIGLKLIFDSRDYIHLPTSGGYYIFSAVYYTEPIGSDFSFNDYLMDLRRYFKIVKGHLVTVQVYGNFIAGNPPFYEMPRLGGSVTMRGYYEGRFRDRYFATMQAEYKAWLIEKWDLGFVLFGGIGDVAYSFSDFVLKNFKYSYGLGLRYVFDVKERLTLRADFAFGKDTNGVYFGIEETF